MISAQGIHQELEHDLLAKKVARELHEQLGILKAPLWHKVIAEKRATFSCEVNLSRPLRITPLDKILMAGDYIKGNYPATLEAAVISGTLAAQAIAL